MPPHDIELPDATQVHLWQTTLRLSNEEYSQLLPLLSDDERERASRFRFERDRIRFVAAHGWLRRLLGAYLSVDPAGLEFGVEAKDKPRLAGNLPDDLRFNISHSQDFAVCAVTRKRDLGVDVEWVPADLDVTTVLPYFTARERAQILALPDVMTRQACIELWVRKEAVLKADGMGLTLAPADIEALGRRQVAVRDRSWTVHEFGVPAGYVAAVAVLGDGVHVPAMAAELGRSRHQHSGP